MNMNYKEAKEYLAKREGTGIHLGLSRMYELCRRLGNPQNRLSFIHIAGTNGKGSTAAFISSILAQNGQVVGRFVSPVVFQYEECIQYEDENGIHYIEKDFLAEMMTKIADASEAMETEGWDSPTVFEMQTALSFLTFCHWHCSVVVLEVGLGGREDATNVISSVLASVITPVSRDHMGMLGETLEEIAGEKAGIIKENGLVITCQKEEAAENIIRKEAGQKRARAIFINKSDIKLQSVGLEGISFCYRRENWHSKMPGVYQMENAVMAIETCRQLSPLFQITKKQISVGIKKAEWRGRFQIVDKNPLTILDGAHNEDGAKALAETIKQLLPNEKIHGIMGVYKDKDYEVLVDVLGEYFSDVTVITAPGARGLDKGILAQVWKRKSKIPVFQADSLWDAKEKIKTFAKEGDVIIWFGSLSFLKEYYKEEGDGIE